MIKKLMLDTTSRSWNDYRRIVPEFESRIIFYISSLLLAGNCLTLGWLLTHGNVLFGRDNLAGHDFAAFWAAGRLAWIGKAAAAYDWTALHDLRTTLLGKTSVDYPTMFGYPPWFLLALAPLGSLPHPIATVIWLSGTLTFYLATIRAILRGKTALIAALAAPAVFSNLYLGQDGLLTAGLLGVAMILLDMAPITAGILIGLLSYKPQFGLLLPLFLVVSARWRVFISAATTVVALAAITMLVFGQQVFVAFSAAIPTMDKVYLQHREFDVGGWGQLANVYGLLRTIGLGGIAAWSGHIAAAVAVSGGLIWIARYPPRFDLQAASVITAAVIASPYAHIWDLVILTAPIALLVRDGLSNGIYRWEWVALAAAFLTPFALPLMLRTRPDAVACVMGPMMCAILACLTARRLTMAALRPSKV